MVAFIEVRNCNQKQILRKILPKGLRTFLKKSSKRGNLSKHAEPQIASMAKRYARFVRRDW